MLATVKIWDAGYFADRICLCDIGLGVWKDGLLVRLLLAVLLVRWQVARFQTENRQGTQPQKTVGTIPVSYTHLDVYKRQDLGTVMGNVYHTKEEMIDCVNAFYCLLYTSMERLK